MSLDAPLSDAELIARAQQKGASVLTPKILAPGSTVTMPATNVTPRATSDVLSIALGLADDPRLARANKTERRYAAYLDLLKTAGEVRWWAFEAVTLLLAADCRFTADFAVQRADRSLELVDVKGRKGESYYATEDARIKLRVAAALFPFRIVVAWEARTDVWQHECFSRDDTNDEAA